MAGRAQPPTPEPAGFGLLAETPALDSDPPVSRRAGRQATLSRLWSPAGFGLVLLLFLLPFLTVSCGGPEIAATETTFTAVDFVVAGDPDLSGLPDAATETELNRLFRTLGYLDTEPLAVLAAIAAMLGMGSGLLRRPVARHGTATVLAWATAALLAGSVVRVSGRCDEAIADAYAAFGGDAGDLTVRTQVEYGFWVVLTLLAVLGLANLYSALRAKAPPLGPARRSDDAAG